jgi:hypothetical protein
MPKYRYWLLCDEEDPENDSVLSADAWMDYMDAAEAAVEDMINDGELELPKSHSVQLAVRKLPDGQAEMFEVYVSWHPTCTAHPRGTLVKNERNET